MKILKKYYKKIIDRDKKEAKKILDKWKNGDE